MLHQWFTEISGKQDITQILECIEKNISVLFRVHVGGSCDMWPEITPSGKHPTTTST